MLLKRPVMRHLRIFVVVFVVVNPERNAGRDKKGKLILHKMLEVSEGEK